MHIRGIAAQEREIYGPRDGAAGTTKGPSRDIMRIPLILLSHFACLCSLVSATALTYKLQPNEKACFFSNADQKGLKLAFYFAVSGASRTIQGPSIQY